MKHIPLKYYYVCDDFDLCNNLKKKTRIFYTPYARQHQPLLDSNQLPQKSLKESFYVFFILKIQGIEIAFGY